MTPVPFLDWEIGHNNSENILQVLGKTWQKYFISIHRGSLSPLLRSLIPAMKPGKDCSFRAVSGSLQSYCVMTILCDHNLKQGKQRQIKRKDKVGINNRDIINSHQGILTLKIPHDWHEHTRDASARIGTEPKTHQHGSKHIYVYFMSLIYFCYEINLFPMLSQTLKIRLIRQTRKYR